jgi:hypothetical protein
VRARGFARSAGPARRRPFALAVDHATGRLAAPSIRTAETRITSFLGALTAIVLLIAAGSRGIQDLPLLRLASRDALYAGVLGIEAVALGISVALGLAAAFVAGWQWTGRIRTRRPATLVFSLVFLFGLVAAAYAYPPARQMGWIVMTLSGAALFLLFRGYALKAL